VLGLRGDVQENVEPGRSRDCKGCGRASLASGSWGLWARVSSRGVVKVDAGAGRETANDPLISVQGALLLIVQLLWRQGLMCPGDCLLCNWKVSKRATRQALSHSAGNPKQGRQTRSVKWGPASSYFAEREVRQRE